MRQRVTALIIQNKKILLVRERGYWYTPGGGVEEGETHLEAMDRECNEEVGCSVLAAREHSIYDCLTIFKKTPQRNYCYLVDIEGEPHALNEMDDVRWFSWEELLLLPDMIPYEKKMIFDRLREEGAL